MTHFSEGQIGILGGNWHFGWGWFSSGGTWKFPTCIENSEYESQIKKNDSNCNFYHFSLLVPHPNNFLVVCFCILIFNGIYPPPINIFFVRLKVFFVSCSKGLGKFQISWGPSLLGRTNIFFGKRGLGYFLP